MLIAYKTTSVVELGLNHEKINNKLLAVISHYASGPKHLQALQIKEVHPGPHSNAACNFLICFSYLSYLGHPSLLYRTTDKDKKIKQFLFSFSCSSSITWRRSWDLRWMVLCMLFTSTCKNCLTKGEILICLLGSIPMIQPSFYSSCVALQLRLEQSFQLSSSGLV